jgi:hypothetical protein
VLGWACCDTPQGTRTSETSDKQYLQGLGIQRCNLCLAERERQSLKMLNRVWFAAIWIRL